MLNQYDNKCFGLHVESIEWDVDEPEDAEDLPTEVFICPAIAEDDVADYLADTYGWCTKGFKGKKLFPNKNGNSK